MSLHDEGNDLPLITPGLMNDKEIDYWVEALKRDVDRAGRKAKGDLRRGKRKNSAALPIEENSRQRCAQDECLRYHRQVKLNRWRGAWEEE